MANLPEGINIEDINYHPLQTRVNESVIDGTAGEYYGKYKLAAKDLKPVDIKQYRQRNGEDNAIRPVASRSISAGESGRGRRIAYIADADDDLTQRRTQNNEFDIKESADIFRFGNDRC